MRIREAIPDDAESVIALFQLLYSETAFLLYEPGESVPRVEDYAQRIRDAADTQNGAMFVAEDDNRLIGVIIGTCGNAKRRRHALFLVMGVLRAHWNQGVGRSLLGAIEAWARTRGLHRLELTVQATNDRAIMLYERMGFVREGTKRDSIKIAAGYVDEFLMSKFVGA
jgi:RimJ/RimL family protein N-acetyltransferase